MKPNPFLSVFAAIVITLSLILPFGVGAQESADSDDQFFRAFVLRVEQEQVDKRENGSLSVRQELILEGLDGEWDGKEVVFNGLELDVLSAVRYRPGDKVMVMRSVDVEGQENFYVIDYVRSGALFWLALLFATVVIAVGRLKGLRAIIVLALSFLVILKFIIPQILDGSNPLFIAIVGSVAILLVSIYLTEGIRRSSHLAIISIGFALTITGLLATWATDWVNLTGFGDEDVMFLVSSAYGAIDVKGLLLAGIVIGALGVLDDVVISQIAVVEQLKRADARLSRRQVYRQAMKVGVSHLSSMVNTLFLAYAGAALPLLMLFGINNLAPLGFSQAISNELVATEAVRTIVGSIGLVLAVPISTLLAVRFVKVEARQQSNV